MTDDRLGGLQNVLAARTTRPRLPSLSPPPTPPASPAEQPAPPADASHDDAAQAPAGQPAASRADRQQTRQRPSSRSPERISASNKTRARVPVRLDPDLRDALAEEARTKHVPQARVVFDAIEQAHAAGTLKKLLEQSPGADREPAASGLFSSPTLPDAQAKVTVELRMTAADKRVLSELVSKHGAADRTHLITVALRDYFADRLQKP